MVNKDFTGSKSIESMFSHLSLHINYTQTGLTVFFLLKP